MIQAKCIQKFRDKNNNIYGYRLQDLNGQTQDVQSKNLKQAIANRQIHVVNLTLTKDNRLVDTTEHHLQSKQLGSAPDKITSNRDKHRENFEEAIKNIFDITIKNIGHEYDSSWGYVDKQEDGSRYTSDAHLWKLYKENGEYCEAWVYIYYTKENKSIQADLMYGSDETIVMSDKKSLKTPLYQKENIDIIQNFMNSFTNKANHIFNEGVSKTLQIDNIEKFVHTVAKLIFKELGYSGIEVREIENLNNSSQDAIDERFEIAGKQLYYDDEIAQLAVTYYFEDKALWVDIDNEEIMSLCEMKCEQPINRQNIEILVKKFVKEIKPHISIE